MERLNRRSVPQALKYTERVIQFGEGNFLRAFADWIIWKMNPETGFDASVVVVKPRSGESRAMDGLKEQDGLYHLNLQGISGGERVDTIDLIDVISRGVNPYTDFESYMLLAEQPDMRFVISNTTEAGIVFDPSCRFTDRPALSYPGKLTQLLYHRFEYSAGDVSKGFIIFPCELIYRNGDELKKCILQYIDLWALPEAFRNWFLEACGVYCTLVDRIVPGYPGDTVEELTRRIGMEDSLLVKSELFHLWAIEAPERVKEEFPASRAGLNVLFVSDETPYHERKVTLLNGPHTALAPVGYLSGLDTVRECVEDPLIGRFVRKVMYEELMPGLNLPGEESGKFASDVLERFANPYIRHLLTGIMLNSFSKYRTRDLPGLKEYFRINGHLPEGLVFALAAICTYYRGGLRGEDVIIPDDDPKILARLKELWAVGDVRKVAEGVLAERYIWGGDLNEIPGLTDMLASRLDLIGSCGMRAAVEKIF